MFASSASHLLRQLTVDSRYLPFAVSRFVKVGMSAQCLSTSPAAADLTVQHDNEKCTFFIKLPEDHSQPGADEPAVLDYEWTNKKLVDLYHTEVPQVFRGRGVAKLLAKAAFDFVVEKDVKMRLTCTYLQKYLKDNPLPEYKERAV